jgi:hypothetical protein
MFQPVLFLARIEPGHIVSKLWLFPVDQDREQYSIRLSHLLVGVLGVMECVLVGSKPHHRFPSGPSMMAKADVRPAGPSREGFQLAP